MKVSMSMPRVKAKPSWMRVWTSPAMMLPRVAAMMRPQEEMTGPVKIRARSVACLGGRLRLSWASLTAKKML